MSEWIESLLSGPGDLKSREQGVSIDPINDLPAQLGRTFHENAGTYLSNVDVLNFVAWFFVGSLLHFPDSGLMDNIPMSDILMKTDPETQSIKFAFLKQNVNTRISITLRSISLNVKDQVKFTIEELNELIHKWNMGYFQLLTSDFDTQRLEILTEYDHLTLRRSFNVEWRDGSNHGELFSTMEKLTKTKVADEMLGGPSSSSTDTFFQVRRDDQDSRFGELLAQFSIPNALKVKNSAQLLMSKIQNTYERYRTLLKPLVSNEISYLGYVAGTLIMNFQERFALHSTLIPMIHDFHISVLSVISDYMYNPKLSSNVPVYVISTNTDTAQKMKSSTTNAGKALLPSFATDSSLAVLSVVNFDMPNQHQISTVEINEGFLSKTLNLYDNPEIHDSLDEVLNAELGFDTEFLLQSTDAHVFGTFFLGQMLSLSKTTLKKYKFVHEIPQLTTYAIEHGKNMLYFHLHMDHDRQFSNIQHKVLGTENAMEHDNFFNIHMFMGDQASIVVSKTQKADILAQKHTLFRGIAKPVESVDISNMIDMLRATNTQGVKTFTENLLMDYAQHCKSDAHIRAFLKGIFHPRAIFLSKFEPHSIIAIVPRQISSTEYSLTDLLRSPAQSDNILNAGRALFIKYKFLHDDNQLPDLVENMSYDFYENYYSNYEFSDRELSPMFMQVISNGENLVHVSTSNIPRSRVCGSRKKRSSACLRRNPASRLKHLERLGTAASVGTLALMGKDIVGQVVQGNYLGALATSGFLVTAPLLGVVSLKMSRAVSPVVRTAAPFIGKLSSAFVIYDLWQNIKDGNKANILADSTLLTLDVAEIGVHLAESFGVVEGVSGVLGPIGAVVGVMVFIGVDIYSTVHAVQKIQKQIRLTTEEKFYEGLRAFFGAPPENHIQKLLQEKDHYQGMFDRALNFLKENANLGGYVFPAQNFINQEWVDEENNYIYMHKNHNLEKLGRNKPQLPKNANFVCFNTPKHKQPIGFGEYMLKFLVHFYEPTYILENVFLEEGADFTEEAKFQASCRRAMGVSVNSKKTLLVDMKNGNDLVIGSKVTSNIFLIGGGVKNVSGGPADDVFIFHGTETSGHFNGRNGQDTVDLRDYAPDKQELRMSVSGKIAWISNYKRYSYFINFENIILREDKADLLRIDCSVKHVDSMNGDQRNNDLIYVPQSACYYNTSFTVGRNVTIKNYAQFGSFDYVVKEDSYSKIYLKRGAFSRIMFLNDLHQIRAIEKLPRTGALVFKFENHSKTVIYRKYKISQKFYFGPNVELNVDDSFHKHAFVKNDSDTVDVQFYTDLSKRIACSSTVHYPNKLTLHIPNPKSKRSPHVIYTDTESANLIIGHGQANIYVVDYKGSGSLNKITIAEKGHTNEIRTLDLRSFMNSTVRKIDILKSDQNLILKIDDLGDILLEDQAYKNLTIVYKNFAYEITDDALLRPLPIGLRGDHLVLVENDLPSANLTFDLKFKILNIDFLKSNQTLIILLEDQVRYFNLILPNFFENETVFIKTLKFEFENLFVDLATLERSQVSELEDQIELEKLEQGKTLASDRVPTVKLQT